MRFDVCSLLAVTLVVLISPAAKAQTLTTLFTNGPTANRINVVVLSEGYQASELGTFLRDASNTVQYLLASPPYSEYGNYFNAFAISVASAQSGSDHHSPTTTLADTYFNSSYDSQGLQRLITIPPNNWDSNYADGRGKVDALLQSLMPEYDIVMLVVNDPQYGGSGGALLVTSVNGSALEVAVHESGHSFGGLGDEYATAFPGWTPFEYPNVTAQTNRPAIRWRPWIADDTPVPTPNSYTTSIGLFEGAEYQTTGWYRPKYDCKMNELGIPFCAVCAEQLVKSIYHAVSPIDAFSPASTNLSVTTANAVAFTVALLQPASHNLSVQWLVNGAAVPGATGTGFSISPQSLPRGTNTIQAQVRDATTLVRNDPANVMQHLTTWNLDVELGGLMLQSVKWLGSGRFAFDVVGTASNSFVIQASTNLLSWLPVATNSLIAGRFSYTNFQAGLFPGRYFRVVVP